MSLFQTAPPALLAQRVVRALAGAKRPLDLADLRAAVGLPPRARRLRPVLEALEDVGLLAVDLGERPVRYRLLRSPAPGELDPPRRIEMHVLGEAAVGTLGVAAVCPVGSPVVRVEVRRQRPGARPLLVLRVADALALAEALRCVAERFGSEAVDG